MGTNNLIFLEFIEWFDETGKELVHRIPESGSGEIKYGAQLTVRESQVAVFFYNGKAVDAFGPGRHTLKTANIPILNKLIAIPWGLTSPLRAEIYFVNMKVFTDLRWGTRDPVAFKDSELGLIRLRAFGNFNLRVVQPLLFINSLVGTQGIYSTDDIASYLNRVIVSRLNDYMGESLDTILNLPARYDEISIALSEKLQKDFNQFGLRLNQLYLNSITPPPEVQQAIDDRSRLGVIHDMDSLLKMKAAMAIEKASQNQGEGSAMGMGTSLGLMMPAMFAHYFGNGKNQSGPEKETAVCSECGGEIPANARFCSHCGHQQLVFARCAQCGKNLTPNARFCSRCGEPVEKTRLPSKCSKCGAENLPGAAFCTGCGQRIAQGDPER
jgi:membrane protease subunit (stomatin/prohibitin family)